MHIHTQTCTQPMNKITHPTHITQPTDAHYVTCTHITVYKNMLRNLRDELKLPTYTVLQTNYLYLTKTFPHKSHKICTDTHIYVTLPSSSIGQRNR